MNKYIQQLETILNANNIQAAIEKYEIFSADEEEIENS